MKKKVLVVIDMQNDFIDGTLGSADAQAIVPNVINKINSWNGIIVATQDTHKSEEYFNTLEGKKLSVGHCYAYTDGWALNTDVEKALMEHGAYFGAFNKPTFGDVFLPEKVQTLAQINQGESRDLEITLIGLDTDICVVSNALLLRASFPNSKITVDSSCCAGTSKEAHEAALTVMHSCQIEVE